MFVHVLRAADCHAHSIKHSNVSIKQVFVLCKSVSRSVCACGNRTIGATRRQLLQHADAVCLRLCLNEITVDIAIKAQVFFNVCVFNLCHLLNILNRL